MGDVELEEFGVQAKVGQVLNLPELKWCHLHLKLRYIPTYRGGIQAQNFNKNIIRFNQICSSYSFIVGKQFVLPLSCKNQEQIKLVSGQLFKNYVRDYQTLVLLMFKPFLQKY